MLKNTAGQKIGTGMVSALDGSAFTGSVTVYITGDNGTQAVGSVGSGACTHKGNGYHTYAPSQAETNYDVIAFTFIGTNAVSKTVTEYTFPPTKNRAGQVVGLHMLATDGTAFAGSVTAYVTGDAGTQAVGSVGSGACTNKGNGYYTYAPAQAETNYDLVSFTFVGTGALAATMQWDMSAERWTPAGERAAVGLASANLDTQLAAAIADSAGVTTLLSRLVGTIAAGTHNPQSGDSYARLGDPTGASVSADIATRLATSGYTAPPSVSAIRAEIDANSTMLASLDADLSAALAAIAALHDFNPATDTVAHVTLVDTTTTLTNAPDVPTEAEIADAVRTELTPELAAVLAMEARMEEQVPTGPVVVFPAPPPGQTTAWVMCYDETGLVEEGVDITIVATKSTEAGAFDSTPVVITSDATGLAQGEIPRGAGLSFTAQRGTNGKKVKFTGVDADTLAIPPLIGAP